MNIMWNFQVCTVCWRIYIYASHTLYCLVVIYDPDIPCSEGTFQLLCYHFQKDHVLATEEWLPEFEKMHRDWIYKITLSHFKKTGRSLDSYLKYWLVPAFPLNEVGIMLLARFFYGHVAIFVNEKGWSTRTDWNLSKINVFLIY